jgi:hypothetical protein
LSDILTEKTARELILRWRNDTLAQKELAKRGTPTALAVLGKTKSLLKEYEQVLTEKMKSNPDLTRKLLTQAGIPKDHIERTFQLLAATKDFSIGLRAILASTLGGKSDAFVENFSKAISLDAGARAQKIESLGKLQKYN